MKRMNEATEDKLTKPAAFRRLCVETMRLRSASIEAVPAAFRRLCVETVHDRTIWQIGQPAAFRRLCVETP